MNENKNHIKQYSAEDIQRYLKGQMSALEMHAIETAALDDPFLADAIEGFEAAIKEGNEESFKTGLGQLNKQFVERIKEPAKVVSLSQSRWWKITAAALILLIAGVAVYNNWIRPEQNPDALVLNETKQNDSSGLQKPEEERSSASATLFDTLNNQDKKETKPFPPSKDISTAPLEDNIEIEDGKRSAKQKKTGLPQQADQKPDDLVLQNAEISGKARQEASTKPPIADQDSRVRQTEVASVSSNEPIVRKDKQSLAQLNNFSGRVVDPNNQPLPNASLQILQNRANLLTDESGNFNFTSRDSVVDVQVGMVGFEQRNYRLQNSIASNNLVLEPSKANLSEVVVSGYGTRRKKDLTKTTVSVQDAVPQIGWIEYEKYLEKNKRPPSSNPLMKGEVVVSFQVKRPAILSDFKIEKSLSKDYDIEAIRLIRDGPAWKLLKGHKTRMTAIVKF